MGEGLFQSGQHQRKISAFRLGEEKVDMLRHDYVTDDCKLMTLADLLHHFEEEIARAGCPEKGTALITTSGNKSGSIQRCSSGAGLSAWKRCNTNAGISL
jgi:hypothetical protein